MKATRSNAQRSEATRAALVLAARALFVTQGHAGTSTPDIVAAANVTRGALYHHFTDKTELFLAVATQMAQEVADAIADTQSGPGSPFDALRSGARNYFAAMAEQGRARILLLDAPAVVSPAQLLALGDASGAAALRMGLAAALDRRTLAPPVIDSLTGLLSAAFDRAALTIAQGEDTAACLTAMDIVIDSLEAWNADAPGTAASHSDR